MMKKLLIAVLLFVPLILSAQSKGYLGVEAGITIPTSPTTFKSYWNPSFDLGVMYDKPVSEIFSVGGEFNYASFSLNKSAAELSNNVTGGSFNAAQLLAVVMASDNNSANSVSPYGKLGLGVSFTSVDDIKNANGNLIFKGSSENGLGVMIAAGLNFNLLSGNKVSIEGSYRVNNRPGDSYNAFLLDVGYHFGM